MYKDVIKLSDLLKDLFNKLKPFVKYLVKKRFVLIIGLA